MGKVIGIDLGTTNSCVAILEGGNPEVIANAEGSRTTPSMVAFSQSGEKLIGQVAKRQAVTNPERTIFATKRLVGRKIDSPEVALFKEIAPFPIEAAENGDAWIRLGDKLRSPAELSALILAKMKETAQDYVGEPVTDAVITVPAYFDDAQRPAQAGQSHSAVSGTRSRGGSRQNVWRGTLQRSQRSRSASFASVASSQTAQTTSASRCARLA